MQHEAVLQITMMARNLADGAVDDLKGGISSLATTATTTASRIGGAFAGMGRSMSVGLGSAVDSLVTGGGLGQAALTMAGFMAGEFTENFGGQIIEKLAGSGIVAAIAGPLGAVGSAMGGLITAAIPIGMAALPFILIGALVAAVAVLIVNEDIRNKVIAFASGLVSTLVNAISGFLGRLPAVVGQAFAAAWSFVVNAVLPFVLQIVTLWLSIPFRIAGLGLQIVQTIANGLISLPGRIADIVRDAFAGLDISIGPFHITGRGITVDLPNIKIPGFAEGVRNFIGGLAVVGERGPELVNLPRGSDVIPHGAGVPAPAGVAIAGITERELLDMVDRGLYFKLQRAAATAGRT